LTQPIFFGGSYEDKKIVDWRIQILERIFLKNLIFKIKNFKKKKKNKYELVESLGAQLTFYNVGQGAPSGAIAQK
jgi:hypothetical protein